MNLLLSLLLLVTSPAVAQVIRQNTGAIGTANIIPGAVDTNGINTDAVTTPKLLTAAVTGVKIAPLTIDSTKMGALSIDSEKVALLSIGKSHLTDAAGETAKLATDSVTSAKLLSDSGGLVKVSGGNLSSSAGYLGLYQAESDTISSGAQIQFKTGAGSGFWWGIRSGIDHSFNIDTYGTDYQNSLKVSPAGAVSIPVSLSLIPTGATDTGKVAIGNATHAGCLMLGDSDQAGCTECISLNGVLTCGIDADCVCDGTP